MILFAILVSSSYSDLPLLSSRAYCAFVSEMMAFPLTQRTVVSSFLPFLSVSKPPTSAFPCFFRREYVTSVGDHIQRAPGNESVSSFCFPMLQSRNLHSIDRISVTSNHAQSASAQTTEETFEGSIEILVHNPADKESTNVEIVAPNWPGILASISEKFNELELEVVKASVELKDGHVFYMFCVQDYDGNAILNPEQLKIVEKTLRRALNPALWSDLGKNVNANKNVSIYHSFDDTEAQRRKRLLWLMDQYLKNDVSSIQKSIVDHVE